MSSDTSSRTATHTSCSLTISVSGWCCARARTSLSAPTVFSLWKEERLFCCSAPRLLYDQDPAGSLLSLVLTWNLVEIQENIQAKVLCTAGRSESVWVRTLPVVLAEMLEDQRQTLDRVWKGLQVFFRLWPCRLCGAHSGSYTRCFGFGWVRSWRWNKTGLLRSSGGSRQRSNRVPCEKFSFFHRLPLKWSSLKTRSFFFC